MQSSMSRVGRWPLAAALILGAACADDSLTTAPHTGRVSRNALDGNVILVTNASGANVPGSLQWAVGVADGTSIIRFDPSLAGATITLDAVLEPFPYITVEGPATNGITLTTTAGRVFRLRQGGLLRNLTIAGGTESPASAIWTLGPLRLENSTITDNHGLGAPIHGFDITLVNSTVSGNSGFGSASAISVGSGGHLVLDNSTVAHNDGAPSIAWMSSPGSAPLVTLRNSIIASDAASTRNCGDWLQFAYEGMNISSDGSCGASPALYVGDPLLLGLASNGGPTRTEGFSYQSPALDAGVNCSVTVDQRYVSRGAICDIGAFEFTDFTVVTLTIDASATVGLPNGAATVTGTISCSRAGDQFGVVVDLEQQQKVGKTTTVIRGTGGLAVTCTTSAQAWSAVVTPASGAFVTGAGSATARTNDVPVWTTPATATRTVKLVRPRR